MEICPPELVKCHPKTLVPVECLELNNAPTDQRRKVYEKARARVSCTDDLRLHRKILTGLMELVVIADDTKYIKQLKEELDSLGPVSDSSDADSETNEQATPDISDDIDINDITGWFSFISLDFV